VKTFRYYCIDSSILLDYFWEDSIYFDSGYCTYVNFQCRLMCALAWEMNCIHMGYYCSSMVALFCEIVICSMLCG